MHVKTACHSPREGRGFPREKRGDGVTLFVIWELPQEKEHRGNSQITKPLPPAFPSPAEPKVMLPGSPKRGGTDSGGFAANSICSVPWLRDNLQGYYWAEGMGAARSQCHQNTRQQVPSAQWHPSFKGKLQIVHTCHSLDRPLTRRNKPWPNHLSIPYSVLRKSGFNLTELIIND